MPSPCFCLRTLVPAGAFHEAMRSAGGSSGSPFLIVSVSLICVTVLPSAGFSCVACDEYTFPSRGAASSVTAWSSCGVISYVALRTAASIRAFSRAMPGEAAALPSTSSCCSSCRIAAWWSASAPAAAASFCARMNALSSRDCAAWSARLSGVKVSLPTPGVNGSVVEAATMALTVSSLSSFAPNS